MLFVLAEWNLPNLASEIAPLRNVCFANVKYAAAYRQISFHCKQKWAISQFAISKLFHIGASRYFTGLRTSVIPFGYAVILAAWILCQDVASSERAWTLYLKGRVKSGSTSLDALPTSGYIVNRLSNSPVLAFILLNKASWLVFQGKTLQDSKISFWV